MADASTIAHAAEFTRMMLLAKRLSPEEGEQLRREYFDERVKPYWGQLDPANQKSIVDVLPYAKQFYEPMARTKEALKPLMPSFTASDMMSVFNNPSATYSDKAKAALGYASHVPEFITKAFVPPAAWRLKESNWDFLPFYHSSQVLSGVGADAMRAAGGPEWVGELGGGALGFPAGMNMLKGAVNIPYLGGMLRRGGSYAAREAQSPLLQRALARYGIGARPSPSTPPVPPVLAQAPILPNQPNVGAGRMRVRYGPNGLEIVE